MNEGAWTILDGDDGDTVALVRTRDPDGLEALLSDCGRRFERDGDDGFIDTESGRRYRARSKDGNSSSGDTPSSDYRVEVAERDGCLEVHISGDHCRSSTVEAQWRRAVTDVVVSNCRSILVVRGPGRVASDIDKMDLLRRFLAVAANRQRVALVVTECERGRSTLLPALAAAHGVTLSIFTAKSAATAWLST